MEDMKEVLFEQNQIVARCKELAYDMDKDFDTLLEKTSGDLVFICILKGAFVFMAELLFFFQKWVIKSLIFNLKLLKFLGQ